MSLIIGILCASCATTKELEPKFPELDVKLYRVESSGLVRKRSNETLTLDQAQGFIALSFDDFVKLLSSCPN